jgi:hypothetical protein
MLRLYAKFRRSPHGARRSLRYANKAVLMRYMLLTYNAPGGREIWAAMTESERRAEEDEYVRLAKAMQEADVYRAANELEPFFAARTVSVRNGKRVVTDGPVVRGEKFLTGYFLIEAESFEAAIEWPFSVLLRYSPPR